jgi:hypothetical protein
VKKSRRDEFGREKHDDSCMCRRCRSREAAKMREGIKVQLRGISKDEIVSYFKEEDARLGDDTKDYNV